MSRVRVAVLLLHALVLQWGLCSSAVKFEKLPRRTSAQPGVRIQADAAYCKALDIFVMAGGYFNVGQHSYLPGDFWLYSFANETWTDLGRTYSQLGVSPGQQFGGTITTIESVTTHCQFLIHGGKTTDPCKPNNFGNTFLVDIRRVAGEFIVSQRLLEVKGGPNAFAQEAVYFNNSVYFVGGATHCQVRFSRKRRHEYYVLRPGLFRYDVARDSWEKLQVSGPDPSQRVEHLFSLYDKPGDPQLIVHGGHDNRRFLSDIWSYSLTSSKWTRLRESGAKITTSIANMHILGDLVYILGGWQVPDSGPPFKSSFVTLTRLGEDSDYGCIVQGERSSFCEMKVANSIGTRFYYVSALRQDQLVVFGGGPVTDSNLYTLNLTKPQVKAIVVQPSVEETPYAMLHIAFVIGISVCLLVTFTAVVQRVLFRRRRTGGQAATAEDNTQTATAGVSESDLKALPIVKFPGKPAAPTVLTVNETTLNDVNVKKDDADTDELAIRDLEKGQGSQDSIDASSSSEASTEASSEEKSPNEGSSEESQASDALDASDASDAGTGAGVKEDSSKGTTDACSNPGEKVVDFGDMCAICICDYNVGDELRVLPCNHAFHTSCVDTWLKLSKACPMCKQDIVIT